MPEFTGFEGWTTFNRHILSAGVDIAVSKSVSITGATEQIVLETAVDPFPCYRRCSSGSGKLRIVDYPDFNYHRPNAGQMFALSIKKLHCGGSISNVTVGATWSYIGSQRYYIYLLALGMTIDDATGLERPYVTSDLPPRGIAGFSCAASLNAKEASADLWVAHGFGFYPPSGTLTDPLTGGTFTPRVPHLLTKVALAWSWNGLAGASVNAALTAVISDVELWVCSRDVFLW